MVWGRGRGTRNSGCCCCFYSTEARGSWFKFLAESLADSTALPLLTWGAERAEGTCSDYSSCWTATSKGGSPLTLVEDLFPKIWLLSLGDEAGTATSFFSSSWMMSSIWTSPPCWLRAGWEGVKTEPRTEPRFKLAALNPFWCLGLMSTGVAPVSMTSFQLAHHGSSNKGSSWTHSCFSLSGCCLVKCLGQLADSYLPQ